MKNLIDKLVTKLVVSAALAMLCATTASAQLKATAGDVEDSRRSDGFFNRLKVDVKLEGPPIASAKGVRIFVTKAVDDTGKNLLSDKEPEKDFKEIDSTPEKAEAKLQIELKNPERRASTVPEISGTVELFTPQKDPKSTIAIPNFQRNIGKPIASPALKAAGIELTVWTKEMFEERKKAEEAKMKKEMEDKAKEAEKSGKIEDAVGVLTEGLA